MRALRAVILRWTLVGTVIALTIITVAVMVAALRFQHSLLDAASVAVRNSVSAEPAPSLATRVAQFHDSLEAWGIAAAAFDRKGTLIAGDERLRSDGLRAGRTSEPMGARQFTFIDTRDGYMLLTIDPTVFWRLRLSFVAAWIVALALAAGAARIVGGRWAKAREVAEKQIIERLRTNDGTGTTTVIVDDPVFGAVSADVAAALERLNRMLAGRIEGEERLRSFLAEAAHELRTPLAIAIGYTGILERGAIDDTALASRIIGDVATEHARLQLLVERILQLARLDAVQSDRDAVSDVPRIIDEAVALVRPLDVDRSMVIASNGPAWAAIAPDDLRDALRNVLENAIRYAPGAKISGTVETAGETIVVRIADAGPGMDAFAASHAFDRFFRGANRGEIPGTGLGLAIVRRVAERVGGAATLTTLIGEGTTVEVRLPRARVAG